MQILIYLQMAFTVWMLIDSVQRKAGSSWFWIIMIFQPVGAWVYFFTNKVYDLDHSPLKKFFDRGPSLQQLRYNHKLNSCLHNKALLANELLNQAEYAEAMELYNESLKLDDEDNQALYGRGVCRLKSGFHKVAIQDLQQLVNVDKSYHDYNGWLFLAEAYWLDGQKSEAIKTLQKLIEINPRISHRTLLGNYLLQMERKTEAKDILSQALEDFDHAPVYIKKSYRKSAAEAKELLKTL